MLKLRVKIDRDDKMIKLNTIPIVLTLDSILWLTFYKKSTETWKNWRWLLIRPLTITKYKNWLKENHGFDVTEKTQKSRMVLEVEFALHTRGVFKASGENCDFLRKVLTEHILPNRAF